MFGKLYLGLKYYYLVEIMVGGCYTAYTFSRARQTKYSVLFLLLPPLAPLLCLRFTQQPAGQLPFTNNTKDSHVVYRKNPPICPPSVFFVCSWQGLPTHVLFNDRFNRVDGLFNVKMSHDPIYYMYSIIRTSGLTKNRILLQLLTLELFLKKWFNEQNQKW